MDKYISFFNNHNKVKNLGLFFELDLTLSHKAVGSISRFSSANKFGLKIRNRCIQVSRKVLENRSTKIWKQYEKLNEK